MASSSSAKDGTQEISSEWIKVISESIGITATVDDGYKYLADDVTFRLKNIIQDAAKLTRHSKRTNLTTHDVDYTLKMKNYEPLYGFTSADYIPFRNVSGGGRDLHFTDDKEIDLDDLTSKPLPKVPLQASIKAHWLAIEGVQPAIPENPPPLSRDLQKLEGINPGTKASMEKLGKGRPMTKNKKDVKVKPLTEHDLSVEQQLYYKEITEACVGADEQRRTEALTSLAQDPGLHKMLPRLSTFISEGVKVNCVNNNLAILIYLMRMLKSLLDNSSLYLEKYLHEVIPSVITCVVSKQLCVKPESDNHWALRDFSSKILGQVCKKFSSSTNDIQTRVVKILSESLHNPRAPLATHYGCIMALGELGTGVVQGFVIPIVKLEGQRLRMMIEGTTLHSADKIAAQSIKQAFVKTLAPVLVLTRLPPDSLDSYRNDYGYLGPYIHEAVCSLRAKQMPSATSLLSRSATSMHSQTLHGPHNPPIHHSSRIPSSPHKPYHPNPHRIHPHRPLPPTPYMPTYAMPYRDYRMSPMSTYHGMHYPTAPTPSAMSGHHPFHWPGGLMSPPSRRAQGGAVTLLNQQTVSRSFSVPSGSRGSTSQPPIIRMSAGGGTSLVRTPSQPNTPGSGTGSQKFIIMSSSGSSSIQPQATTPSPTIVKVMTSAGLQPAQNTQTVSLTKSLTLQAQAHAQAAGDQTPNLLTPKAESLLTPKTE